MNSRILAYHRVANPASSGLSTWSVSPAAFRRQMLMLKRLGFRGVSVRTLMESIGKPGDGERLIGITFDDGYLDTVTAALPVLDECGFTASVYIVPDYVGGRAEWEQSDSCARLANWDDLARLRDAGWEIGAHSRSHPPRLDLLSGLDLELQIRGGVRQAADRLNTPIDSFAFPHGHRSSEAITTLREAGFRTALTQIPGVVTPVSDRLQLARYEIKRRDSLAEFVLIALAGVPLRRRATLSRLLAPFTSETQPLGPGEPSIGDDEPATVDRDAA